ncbi:putative N-acetyltransferase YhbS/diadenosine tetraphosphate (Ap4A) HIT family hydrolase [Desulfobaculum xiamenense]|uniref:Putative N-acetyltransferase YhbS/diadenosine tetraphosphate (Ap4A) HIT family hydrolase n=1 Tax=Desulfobaculum xiamenense TaxID=995050 RepID=A0A846QQ97_9BACT|nr:GNAT family N-acetyltransferase [Desulfobaculum xiamenense]NJB68513.1 putative N-acetyltransferase YhbS/diadenosine tetraphosphate (Ap4A) HIT family hydrolase [Desulfobaculum xiamenense]
MTFHIHSQLLKDCHVLGRYALCHVLLHRNAALPWFILVPEVEEEDLLDLPEASRDAVMAEAARVSAFVKEQMDCAKVNVAAIGNVVRQLHIHVVGRNPGDACWPAPVWGNLKEEASYSEAEVTAIVEALRSHRFGGMRPVPHGVRIREERPSDHAAIRELLLEAFADHPYSHQTEHLIVEGLREDNALTLGLVVEDELGVAGYVAFSPVDVAGREGWYGLGPLAVFRRCRRDGLGSMLVREGLDALRRMGAHGCVLVGDPVFYGRFGFRSVPGLGMSGVPDEFVLALAFSDAPARGEIVFHRAFSL